MISVVAKVIKAGHKARKLARYISGKAVGMTADFGFGTMKLRRPQLDWAIQALRSHHGESRASEVRHVVLSTPKGTPRHEAKKVIRAVWEDFISTYAPGQVWMFGLQFHNGILHGHGAIANVNSHGRPLGWKPHQVVAMSEMAFTDKAVSAKGKGKKGLPIYTKARKKLSVQDLAEQLVDDAGNLRANEWERLKTEGVISNLRIRKKDGVTTSFEFEGRRIRIRTLRAFVSEKQNTTKDNTMPIETVNPTQPLPDSLAAKLTAAGFSKQALNSLNSQLGAAHAASVPEHKPRTKTINPETPKL